MTRLVYLFMLLLTISCSKLSSRASIDVTSNFDNNILFSGSAVGQATTGKCTITTSVRHVSINPGTYRQVSYGSTVSFSVTSNNGYKLSNAVGGTCPAGSWNGNTYTTGKVTQDCSVEFFVLGAEWARSRVLEGTSSRAEGVSIDRSGNVYAVGDIYNGTYNFGNNVSVIGTYDIHNVVIVKYKDY